MRLEIDRSMPRLALSVPETEEVTMLCAHTVRPLKPGTSEQQGVRA
jgi:hypothetical protein